MVDFGRIATTLVNVKSGDAVRVAPRLDIRTRAFAYAPGEKRRYFAMLTGYQVMPDELLLSIKKVDLTIDLRELISRPGVRTDCERCGEEIINEREVLHDGATLCRACAGESYYR